MTFIHHRHHSMDSSGSIGSITASHICYMDFEQFELMCSDIKWDEMNILQTLHPPDKDYGFMKINEPKTPYSYDAPPAEGDSESSTTVPVQGSFDPDAVVQKISSVAKERRLSIDDAACSPGHDADEDDEDELTEEEKQRRKEFEMKRKSHYNEFQVGYMETIGHRGPLISSTGCMIIK